MAAVCLTMTVRATEWTTYHDHDFLGYKITYPSFLHAVPSHLLHPDDNSGVIHWRTSVYASADGEEQLYFNFFPWDDSDKDFTLQKYFQDELS